RASLPMQSLHHALCATCPIARMRFLRIGRRFSRPFPLRCLLLRTSRPRSWPCMVWAAWEKRKLHWNISTALLKWLLFCLSCPINNNVDVETLLARVGGGGGIGPIPPPPPTRASSVSTSTLLFIGQERQKSSHFSRAVEIFQCNLRFSHAAQTMQGQERGLLVLSKRQRRGKGRENRLPIRKKRILAIGQVAQRAWWSDCMGKEARRLSRQFL